MERFDVAIVGAGPAGSSSAISLARKGYSVLLLDKALFPREKLCGDFLNPINWPLFERLGMAEELLSLEHEEVKTFRISSFRGQEAAFRLPAQAENLPFGLGLRRCYLDDLLLRQAEKDGAVVKQGFDIRDLGREEGGWSVTVDNHSMEESVHSAFLIGADGRNSWVARRLGLAHPHKGHGGFVGFQLHLTGAKGIKEEVQIHLFPGGYAGLVGLGGGVANLCLSMETRKVREVSSMESLWENHLYKNPHLREAVEGAKVVGRVRSTYPVYFPPRRSYGNRFLLAGDAARVTEPVTGEGVYFALKGGELAAAAIHLAFSRKSFSSKALSAYESACQRAFSSRQRLNRAIRVLIYHPSLLTPLIGISTMTSLPIGTLVKLVCAKDLPRP